MKTSRTQLPQLNILCASKTRSLPVCSGRGKGGRKVLTAPIPPLCVCAAFTHRDEDWGRAADPIKADANDRDMSKTHLPPSWVLGCAKCACGWWPEQDSRQHPGMCKKLYVGCRVVTH